MSTSNVPILPPSSTTPFQKLTHLLGAHEKLWIVLALAVASLLVVGKVENMISAHDQKVLSVKEAQLQATVDKNAILAKAAQEAAAQSAAATSQAIAANAQLAQANQALVSALTKQQAVDRTLPPAALAQRIQTLSDAPAGSVVPGSGGYIMTQDSAVHVAVALESVPALIAELKNAQQQFANEKAALDASAKDAATAHEQVGGLQTQLKQADGVCEAKIAVVKDKARKSKLKWFIGGYIGGLITRPALKLFTGI